MAASSAAAAASSSTSRESPNHQPSVNIVNPTYCQNKRLSPSDSTVTRSQQQYRRSSTIILAPKPWSPNKDDDLSRAGGGGGGGGGGGTRFLSGKEIFQAIVNKSETDTDFGDDVSLPRTAALKNDTGPHDYANAAIYASTNNFRGNGTRTGSRLMAEDVVAGVAYRHDENADLPNRFIPEREPPEVCRSFFHGEMVT